jgi:hypothetical protein
MRLFSKGNRVTHTQYGHGTITSTDEQYTVIEFDEHGRKMFITNMVSLEATGEPAPAKPSRAKRARKAKAADPSAPAKATKTKTAAKSKSKTKKAKAAE